MALQKPITPLEIKVQTEVVSRSADQGPHPEIVLLLHTSGTSGNKKLVPYSLEALVVGVACIAASWNLVLSL